MASTVIQDDLSNSLLAFVADGQYPDSEDVISANVTPDFLPKGLHDISVARAQVEVSSESTKFLTTANNAFSPVWNQFT